MRLASRGRKSSPASRAAPAHCSLFIACALAASSVGCDIVQGFQDAGDSLFPEQSTHLASPGLRLVSGGYRELGIAAGSELHLLARGADDTTGKLFVMRYADPHPCSIDNVVRFAATREPSRNVPLFSYFYENVRQGTLHFADANCKVYDLTFDDAQLPVAETEKGLVIWAGSELWLAVPETGARTRLAESVEDVVGGVFGRRFAVRANGRVTLFDSTWKAQGTFGDKVTALQRASKTLFYTDSAGLHRIIAGKTDAQPLEDSLLSSDACGMGMQDGTWLTYRSPCSGGRVLAAHEPTGQVYTLPFDADPRQLKLVPALKSRGLDPTSDPFWFFFMRNGASDESRNTLFVRTPMGDERALGARSTLLQLRFFETATDVYGYALVDITGETGRYVWWNAAGETRTLAQNAMWRTRRLVVDFDGAVGSVAATSGDRLTVLAERVPWQAFEYQDATKAWTVFFHDLDAAGQNGKLSAFYDGIDGLQAIPPDKPFAAPALLPVASNVPALRTGSLNDVLSGVIYFKDMDFKTGTGELEYRNLELRFTARINDDVSDYVVSHDEVLYTIPYGDNAGIWLVSGK
jgi:hypothetical protein